MSTRDRIFHPFEVRGAFAFSLVLSFVIIFGLAWVVAYSSYRKAIDAAIRTNETRATLLAKLVLEHQRAAIGILESYADRPLLVNSVKRRDFEGALHQLIDLVKRNPEMDWPFLSNADGTVWVNYPVDRQAMNKDLSFRDWYKGVSKEWKPYISSVYKLIVGEKDLAVAVTVPIFDEKRKIIGILCTAQSTGFFQKVMSEAVSNADAKITLVDQEGHIIYSNEFPYTKEVISYPPLESIQRALKGGRGNARIRDTSDGGGTRYVSIAPIEGIGWSVIVQQSRDEILRSAVPQSVLIGVIALLIYGVAALTLLRFRERHRQIKELDGRVRERTAELEAKNKALRESEERFRTLANATFEGIAITEHGRFFDANEQFLHIVGSTRSELIGQEVAPLVVPEDRDRVMANILQGVESHTEHQIYRRDGTRITVETHGRTISYQDRQVRITAVRDITERKRTEEALRRQAQLLHLSYDAIIVWRVDGGIESWNRGAEQLYGFTESEALGWVTHELLGTIHPVPWPEIQTAMRKHGQWEGELRHRTKEGREVFVSARLQLMYGGDGIDRVLETNRDITDRKQTEDALRESEERLRRMIQTSPVAIGFGDSTGKIFEANESFYRLTGYTAEEIQASKLGWNQLTAPEYAELDSQIMTTLAATGSAGPYEKEYIRKDGSRVPLLLSVSKFPGRDEHIAFIVDITERKRAEEALRANEARRKVAEAVEAERKRFYDVLETLPAMVCLLTSDYRVTFANRSFREKFGESDGRHCYEYCFGRTKPCEFCESYNVLKTGEPHHWEVTAPDGSIIDAYDFPFTDVDGSPLILEMDIDITDRKRGEQELKEKARELADLSSQLVSAQENERKRVSYDLHDNVWQMLMTIRLEIDRLFSGQEDWEALRNKSKQVTTNIVGLVGRIRSMQGDLWPYVLDDIGLAATLDWYCREFEKNHSGLVIETKNELTEGEVPSSVKIVIYRILQEALGNVAKHSQAEHVTVHLMKKDHGIEFNVQDDGIGFDPEERIAKRAPLGGLGLLSIKARTELSGGSFGVESVKEKGTMIRASWPFA